ncbi:MAG: ribonuclease HII [bacterium]
MYKFIIRDPNIKWGVGKVSEKVIDKVNILEATKLAMKKAVNGLKKKLSAKTCDRRFLPTIDFLILDGKIKLDLNIPQKSIVKADEKVFSCSAASIIAKVTRDRIMERLDKKYPQYGFKKHKGYPTKYHIKMLRKHSPCRIHRQSFGPVKKANVAN